MVMEVVLEVTVECENYSRYDNIFNIVVILNKISFFSDRPVPLGNGHGGEEIGDVNKKLVIGEVVKQCKFLLNILRTVEGYL